MSISLMVSIFPINKTRTAKYLHSILAYELCLSGAEITYAAVAARTWWLFAQVKSDMTVEKIEVKIRRMATIISLLAELGVDVRHRYQRVQTGMMNSAGTVARRTIDATALTRSGSKRKIPVVSGFVFCRSSWFKGWLSARAPLYIASILWMLDEL